MSDIVYTNLGVFRKSRLVTVKEIITGVHNIHTEYPLIPGDGLIKRDDGTYAKLFIGVQIEGFNLTDDQIIPFTEWEESR